MAQQLDLFPDQAHLVRIDAAAKARRFYRLVLWPDLFGRCILVREWGRIGQAGQVRHDIHSSIRDALNALETQAARKRRRGYRDGDGPPA